MTAATTEVRDVTVGDRLLRVAVRPGPNGAGTGPRPPLLLINGIGASLELLEPFVAELDPAVEVIRFDPPGVGGSPADTFETRSRMAGTSPRPTAS